MNKAKPGEAPTGAPSSSDDLGLLQAEAALMAAAARPPPGEATLAKRIMVWLVPNLTAFTASFLIMVLELVAGRMIARYLGSSLYTWTSVIGIVLLGITLGNLLGGRLADWFRPVTTLAALFLLAAGACVAIPLLNQWVNHWVSWKATPANVTWFVHILHWLAGGEGADPADPDATLHIPWSARIFGHVLVVFLLPSLFLGTIGPVVAKMALDQGRAIGRTVGNVYAWGALGSIVGTFFTGFYLISKLGTEATVLGVGVFLGVVGIIYSLARLWTSPGPAAAVISFLTLSWAYLAPAGALVSYFLVREGWPFEWVERGGELVLRETPKSFARSLGSNQYDDILYLDESDYSFIKVDRETETEDGEIREKNRDLTLDNLVHAYWVPDKPDELEYDYEDIYKALTHRFGPSVNRRGAAEGRSLTALFIGGGGYVFPRYLRTKWPDCHIQIAEIDPAVTEAVLSQFGLDRSLVQIVKSRKDLKRDDNPYWIYHMDARNHIEDLVRMKDLGRPVPEFDFIYGDAFNDYAVPFHLTTRELNDKVKRLLKPGSGIYMINIIDIFNPGSFLGAIYNTFRETFGENVYVFCNNKDEPSETRDTYIVVGSLRPLDLSGLPADEEPYQFVGSLLTAEHLTTLTDRDHAGDRVLTDDFAPVEFMLRYVVDQH